jgi:two-component system sensor histidine kinase UhpB
MNGTSFRIIPRQRRVERVTLSRVRAAAQRICAGEAGVRVPVPGGDSAVAVLARALNAVQQQRDDDRRRLREVAARAFRAQETERARLAHELQEETAQTLSALLLRLGGARRQADPAMRDAALDDVRALLSETTDAVRGFARRLVPPALKDAGLVPALQSYAASLAESSGIAIILDCADVRGLLHRDGELALYRVVQEALANAVRHAGAARIRVVVERRDDRVRATVTDEGTGFDLAAREAADPCLGLFGMRERAGYAGGSAAIRSTPGLGTRVTVELPVEAEPSAATPWPPIVAALNAVASP